MKMHVKQDGTKRNKVSTDVIAYLLESCYASLDFQEAHRSRLLMKETKKQNQRRFITDDLSIGYHDDLVIGRKERRRTWVKEKKS